MLRNNELKKFGVDYSYNVYKIENRNLIKSSTNTMRVIIFISTYLTGDMTEDMKITREKPLCFVLENLPVVDTELTEELYETELKLQHGDEIVDGTPLSEFITILE